GIPCTIEDSGPANRFVPPPGSRPSTSRYQRWLRRTSLTLSAIWERRKARVTLPATRIASACGECTDAFRGRIGHRFVGAGVGGDAGRGGAHDWHPPHKGRPGGRR